MRFTHRRCRVEVEGLAEAAHHQTQRAEALAAELDEEQMAHSYLLDEIRDACRHPDHVAEAVIPEVLREHLVDHQIAERELTEVVEQVDQLTAERDQMAQGLDRMLHAAHAQGRLARTYALMEGAELGPRQGLAAWLARTRLTGWTGFPDWPCPGTDCTYDTRELVWHPDAPDRAHLACECGRVWPAGPGAAERAERETEACRQVRGGSVATSRRWSHMPAPLLEAIDRALPPRTPAQLRDREALPA